MKDQKSNEKLEEELQENKEKYRSFFDNILLSSQSLDKDGCFREVNPAWLKTLGYSKDEVIGKWFGEFLHPNWKTHFKKSFSAFKKRGYVNDMQFKIRHKNGHYLDISFEGSIGYKSDGSFNQTYCVFHDITKQKQAEETIKHINIVLRTISSVNQLIVVEKNRDELIRKVCEILIKNHAYANAWIVLLGKDGEYLTSTEAGLGKRFLPLKKMLVEGTLPDCGRKTLKKKDMVIIEKPHEECPDCPLSKGYAEYGGYTICLKHGSEIYGLLTVSVPLLFIDDKTEQNLFWESGQDIGFALNSIEIEEKHRNSESKLLLKNNNVL